MNKLVGLNIKEIVNNASVEIQLNGAKEFAIRTWIAVKLINLAQWISWFRIEIKVVENDFEIFTADVIYTQTLNVDVINVNDINYN